jgi:hypothetical protein
MPLDAAVYLKKRRETPTELTTEPTATGANNGVLATNGHSEKLDESDKTNGEITPATAHAPKVAPETAPETAPGTAPETTAATTKEVAV